MIKDTHAGIFTYFNFTYNFISSFTSSFIHCYKGAIQKETSGSVCVHILRSFTNTNTLLILYYGVLT